RDLVPEHETLRCCCPPTHHVLIRSADVRGDSPEDRAMRHLPADIRRIHPWPIFQLELRVGRVDDFDDSWSFVRNRSITSHVRSPSPGSIARSSMVGASTLMLRASSILLSRDIAFLGRSAHPKGWCVTVMACPKTTPTPCGWHDRRRASAWRFSPNSSTNTPR